MPVCMFILYSLILFVVDDIFFVCFEFTHFFFYLIANILLEVCLTVMKDFYFAFCNPSLFHLTVFICFSVRHHGQNYF